MYKGGTAFREEQLSIKYGIAMQSDYPAHESLDEESLANNDDALTNLFHEHANPTTKQNTH